MALEQISIDKAKDIAKKNGLKPAKVKGTDIVRFMKNPRDTLEEITWEEMEKTLNKNKLAIYASGTWMKIMKVK
jgi:hypothetical protein